MLTETKFFLTMVRLLRQVDQSFATMQEKFQDEVCCHPGCDDCCHACFSVSFAEALLMKYAIANLSVPQKDVLGQRARAAEAQFSILENKIGSQGPDAKKEIVSTFRLRCPFLLPDSCQCLVYDFRPATCRVYGLPTSIGNQGHVCGLSGFAKGTIYPTIKLDNINSYLDSLSEEAVRELDLHIDSGKRYFIHQIVLQEEL